jgi:hypothetical protein
MESQGKMAVAGKRRQPSAEARIRGGQADREQGPRGQDRRMSATDRDQDLLIGLIFVAAHAPNFHGDDGTKLPWTCPWPLVARSYPGCPIGPVRGSCILNPRRSQEKPSAWPGCCNGSRSDDEARQGSLTWITLGIHVTACVGWSTNTEFSPHTLSCTSCCSVQGSIARSSCRTDLYNRSPCSTLRSRRVSRTAYSRRCSPACCRTPTNSKRSLSSQNRPPFHRRWGRLGPALHIRRLS